MNLSLLIKNYINQIINDINLDIIIYDDFNAFADDEILSSVRAIGKWHLNNYCLKIKENPKLQKRCISLKKFYNKKAEKATGFFKSTCHCGVTEYAVPVVVNNTRCCIISATGFYGNISDNTERILAKRCNTPLEKFKVFRESNLLKTDIYDERKIKTYLETLAFMFERYFLEKIKKREEENKYHYSQNQYILKALYFIEENFTKDITVCSVANYCHISPSYLKHLFSKFLGHGVSKEIISKRINYAKELLLTTDFSVRYISVESGFKNEDYFSSVFKKEIGTPPLKYRKAHSKISANKL